MSSDVIHVGTPRRVRRTLPGTIRVSTDDHDPTDIVTHDGIPIVKPGRAILDSRTTVMADRLVDAAREANRRGLLGLAETEGVIKGLSGG